MTAKNTTPQLKLSILTLSMLLTFGAQAGNVGSTFATGDTLTATQMTEIKDAVNDNDTRITSFFGGDGSAGDLTVSASEDWSAAPPVNPYFNNITIDAGQTLTVSAGTTIRCSGDFVNNGTIAVNTGANGEGTSFSVGATGALSPYTYAHPGDTRRAAIAGAFGSDMVANPLTLNGGIGGLGIAESEIRLSSFSRFRIGGGAGAGQYLSSTSGGGLIKIYCQGSIINAGTIQANGQSTSFGHGGGGGGIVILASRTLVDNSAGTISVMGGNGGGTSSSYAGSGGGGGGGIIVLASPTTPVLGTETVTGGIAGASGATLTSPTRHAGGGGGASGGNGGFGGGVTTTAGAASDGIDGYVVTMEIDPIWIAR